MRVCDAPAHAMAWELDELVEQAVLAKLAKRVVGQPVPPQEKDRARLHERLAVARAKREPFEDPEFIAQLGREATLRALRKVDAEIERLQDELAEVMAREADAGQPLVLEVAELWPELTVPERRQVIGDMLRAVLVRRAPRGTPLAERTTLVWKGEELPVDLPAVGRPRKPEPAERAA